MNMKSYIAVAALGLGVALSSPSAFAQNGPSALNFTATSNPQTGGQQIKPSAGNPNPRQPAPKIATDGPAGPAGANFTATSNPQTGR